ncbi:MULTISPECIES: DUF5304 domain-containing protein [unclassified Streptomyces]|uniref:DUF5304 domain-containing protein n=1 Tax=Streptomyces sp. R33 TaxID=3238629 RepID=A0AB39YBA6_9ACTN|nr:MULTISPECIES: DUF5304 domain-containing protein [unclassified Streptomyces]KJY39812.1 hypothetical protein VR46_28600 [Streptomyces sp. NRRL S-444]KOY59412.1 hypothetical protein ADK59_03945 [Streptomyces sp. XY332]TDU78626.1 hypothetical protein EDD91_5416 [Streptomyces sp. KS 21]THA38788.1 hypothetical protein E6W17_14410 [Streptomyces sp. A1547]
MSEATDRPTDDDAWAKACAEDLAAEQERRRARQGGTDAGTGTAAEELFKLFEAVADKVSGLNNPLLGAAAQGAVRQFVNQAKAAAKPVVERNPEVFDHLAAAGSELLAAYRSAVEGHERRWTRDEPAAGAGPDGPSGERPSGDRPSGDRSDPRDGGGSGPTQRIDLD